MLEAAAEHADGVILNLWPKDALPKMMEHIRLGAERAGKTETPEVVNRFMVCVTDDVERARNAFRGAFAPYYATPQYNAFLAWSGYEDAAKTIAEGWAEKNREKTGGALDDDLVDAIGVIGSAEHCRERIRWAMETGVDTAIIAPIGVTLKKGRQRSRRSPPKTSRSERRRDGLRVDCRRPTAGRCPADHAEPAGEAERSRTRCAASFSTRCSAGDRDPEVKCSVLRGAGGHFSAGYDLKQNAAEGQPFYTPQGLGNWPRHVVDGFFFINDLAKPVIAQVEGYCLAGGTELPQRATSSTAPRMQRSDIRWSAPSALRTISSILG